MENDIQKLHDQFIAYGKNAREWLQKCALLLPEIVRRGVWKKKGYGSVHEYAGKLAGMSHSLVDEALRVLRHVETLPELRKVVEERGIGAVRPVAVIATPETDLFWAEKVRAMSQHTLEVYVQEAKSQNLAILDENHPVKNKAEFLRAEESEAEKINLTMQMSPDLANKLTKLKGHGEWEDLLNELLAYREQVLQNQQPEEKVTDARHIPATIEKFIIERSRGICEFPKCTRKYAILHHTQRFSLEKTHDPERIIALCTAHERIVHQGLIENENQPPQQWRVREQPDTAHPTYAIDQLVQKYRKPG